MDLEEEITPLIFLFKIGFETSEKGIYVRNEYMRGMKMGYILPIFPNQQTQYGNRGRKITSKEKYVYASNKIKNDLTKSSDLFYKGQDVQVKQILGKIPSEKGKGQYIDVYI